MESADRIVLCTTIENEIIRLNPSFDEALEIAEALRLSIKRRYPAEQVWDCEHYFEYLAKALERAPMLAPPEVDECALSKEEKE